MSINRPSLYATFGNKHDLFMAAIDRYAVTLGCQPLDALLNEPDIPNAVAAFFETSIGCVTAKGAPRGCLIASVATDEAEKDERVRDKLAGFFGATDRVVGDHFRTAQDNGKLSKNLDPQALARMIISISHGFAVRARVGASRKELSRLAGDFLAMLFPKPT